MKQAGRSKIWKIPMILSVLTALGLLLALFGEGVWLPLSWLATGIPLLVVMVKTAGR